MTHLEKICLGKIPVYALLLMLLGAGAAFMVRPPVVIVTDDVFSAVYGVRREHFKRIEMSVQLFRRIKLVRMSADAELDAVIFAIQDASKNPLAAVFPYRYYNAALRYAATNTMSSTVVLAGLNRIPAGTAAEQDRAAILFVKQDESADFYRAGLCAALFSGRSASFTKVPDGDKSILVITNEKNSTEAGGFFERGLVQGGSSASSVFRGINDNYPLTNLSCVVFWGQSSGFLYNSAENSLPNIVFSWMEPNFFSPGVKVIIDDSPLQLLPLIVRSLKDSGVKLRLAAGEDTEVPIPSTFKVMALRTASLPLMFSLNIASHLPVNLGPEPDQITQ
ncbi:MAG: hypothetical protein LBF83_09165 [Spirochaetaceae bacterium]|jgi:hypothetical protein|nr:hypothetical protein [Spirochaetaceae bacterium]